VTADRGFTLSRKPADSLRPGRSTWIRISCSPLGEGAASAVVSIGNNDADENPFTFTVSATGTVPPSDDHGDSAEDATVLSESSATGVIGDRNDEDYFSFTTETEVQVVIETTGDLDTYGRLYDGEGLRLASDHNDGEGRNFRIVKAVPAGTFFVRVSARGSTTGDYTLTVTTSKPLDLVETTDSTELALAGADSLSNIGTEAALTNLVALIRDQEESRELYEPLLERLEAVSTPHSESILETIAESDPSEDIQQAVAKALEGIRKTSTILLDEVSVSEGEP
jgi:hypothetical protein